LLSRAKKSHAQRRGSGLEAKRHRVEALVPEIDSLDDVRVTRSERRKRVPEAFASGFALVRYGIEPACLCDPFSPLLVADVIDDD